MNIAVVALAWANPFNETAREALDEDAGWEDVGTMERGAITVQGRHKVIEGVDCLEASAVTTHDVETMKGIVLDIRGNTDWSSAELTRSDVLKATATEIDYVQVLDVPAPLSDRYWFLHGEVEEGDDVWHFRWSHLEGADVYPEIYQEVATGDLVEVDVNVGSWALLPTEGGTLARFRSCTNVGGSVPAWAGEKAARMMLPNNIEDLFREAEKRSSQ